MITISFWSLVVLAYCIGCAARNEDPAAPLFGLFDALYVLLKWSLILAVVLGPILWVVGSYGEVAVKGVALIALGVVGLIVGVCKCA